MPSLSGALAAAALRGDDALARAAADAAAPRRRLIAALRDAHAEAALRTASLRSAAGADQPPLPPPLLARLLQEAEAQLHRLELVFAHLPERPVSGQPRGAGARTAAGAAVFAREERRGAAEARALRDLAHLGGQHLAARLLDISAAERAAAAAALEHCAEVQAAQRRPGG